MKPIYKELIIYSISTMIVEFYFYGLDGGYSHGLNISLLYLIAAPVKPILVIFSVGVEKINYEVLYYYFGFYIVLRSMIYWFEKWKEIKTL